MIRKMQNTDINRVADIFPPPGLTGIPILSHGIVALYFAMLKSFSRTSYYTT